MIDWCDEPKPTRLMWPEATRVAVCSLQFLRRTSSDEFRTFLLSVCRATVVGQVSGDGS